MGGAWGKQHPADREIFGKGLTKSVVTCLFVPFPGPLHSEPCEQCNLTACSSSIAVPSAGCDNRFLSTEQGGPAGRAHPTCLLLPSSCAAFSAKHHSPFATSRVCISVSDFSRQLRHVAQWLVIFLHAGHQLRPGEALPAPAPVCPSQGTHPSAPQHPDLGLVAGLLQNHGCGGDKGSCCCRLQWGSWKYLPPLEKCEKLCCNHGTPWGHPRSQRRGVHWEHKLLVVSGNWPSATGRGCSADLWAKGEQREACWSTQPQPSLGSVGRAVVGLCLSGRGCSCSAAPSVFA